MKYRLKIGVATATLLSSSLFAIDMDQVQIFGYGNVYYQNYDYIPNYQSKPENRAKVDLERFVLAPQFIVDDNIKIVSEVEFEHGGTGVTTEYDTLDEFGEFESEIEKGGEVVVEEAYVDFSIAKEFNIRAGHSVVPVGLNSQRHLPSLYLSTMRNISETTILPNTWHESGVTAYGKIGEYINYQTMIMTGLNSEFFNSHHWIREGNQKRFESVNADNLAFALRVDIGDVVGSHIGFSYYVGNSNKNRNKSKLNSAGTVSIYDVHAVYDAHNVRLRALALLGTLSDSEAISQANHNLPNALEAKRTPVAKEAVAYFVEAGYNISSLFGYSKEITPFVKYDYVNSMYKTEGVVQVDDRYETTSVTAGIAYFVRPEIVLKADYTTTSYGPKSKIEDLHFATLAMGFQF